MAGDEDLAIAPEARIECRHQSIPVNGWSVSGYVAHIGLWIFISAARERRGKP
jgi:hypothetical protein